MLKLGHRGTRRETRRWHSAHNDKVSRAQLEEFRWTGQQVTDAVCESRWTTRAAFHTGGSTNSESNPELLKLWVCGSRKADFNSFSSLWVMLMHHDCKKLTLMKHRYCDSPWQQTKRATPTFLLWNEKSSSTLTASMNTFLGIKKSNTAAAQRRES